MRAAVLLLSAALIIGCTEISRPPAPPPTQATPVQPTATRPPVGQTPGPIIPTPQTPAVTVVAVSPTAPPSGGPVSLNDVQTAWAARGLAVTRVEQGTPATGFTVAPSSLAVAKGSDSSTLLVFTYPNQRALEEDWNVSGTPAPKPGKSAGTYNAVWWNQNVMVVLRTRGDTSDDEARDAFLALGPAVSPVGPPIPLATTIAATATVATAAATAPAPAVATSTPVPTATRPAPGPTLAPPR